ncbi:MAG: MarR family winged helix-turn-helix transcriptional regulator [Hyphomicrobiaceae bacterium]|nr:MarR family winged helix-turn-helix transcriptional regulator [Hyphomicrobiaceae bacterium]
MFSMTKLNRQPLPHTAAEIGEACVCLGLRKAARQVARRYDEALRPLDLTSGQFSIIAALVGETALPLGALAERLGMDRTTLNRNLKPLEARRLIATAAAEVDKRVRGLALTAAGRNVLAQALPLWASAQEGSARRLGERGWRDLRERLRRLD